MAVSVAAGRARSIVGLAALLLGTVGPALSQPPAVRTAVCALAAVITVAWLVPTFVGRTAPRASALAVICYAVAGAVSAVILTNGAALAFPAIGCLNAGARWPRRAAVAFTALLAAGYAVGRLVHPDGDSPWWALLGPVIFTVSLLGGVARAKGERLAAQAEQERARAVALDERARIAREIHDILAHALAALTIQLETADALLDGGRVAQAQESVRRAGRLAREGLTETRRAIGVLRGESVPLPDLLHALAADFRSTVDIEVTVAVTGPPRDLEPDVVLALYRTAQEALTNATKHAPGAAIRVDLHFEPDRVRLGVVNAAPAGSPGPLAGTGGGYGLAGLRERAELAGGSLESGPAGDGYRVGVTIPA